MANIQIRKTDTGQVMTVDENSPIVKAWVGKGWEVVGKPPSPATQPSPAPQSGNVQVFSGYGDAMSVPAADVPYWEGQGWSRTRPSSAQARPSAAPAARKDDIAELTAPNEALEKSGILDGMSPEQAAFATVQANAIEKGTPEAQRSANEFVADAVRLSDPYYKAMAAVALDEFGRSVTSSAEDLKYRKSQIDAKISQLNEDLAYNRDTLSVNEQAEMSNLLKDYEANREGLDLQMQEAGLAFSSPRAVAEKRLLSAQQDTAQSIRRRYAGLQREQELTALRNRQALEQERGLAERQYQEGLTSTARAAESKLGSAALPSAVGGTAVPKMGGIESGDIAQQRASAIINLSDVLSNRGGTLPSDVF